MTLTAYYDLAVGPVSYDFVVFSIKAEMVRRKVGADHLHLVIVPKVDGVGGMFRNKTHLYDEHEMRWRLWNICIPAASLLGASITLATGWEQARKLQTSNVWPVDWDRQTLKDRRHLIGDIITWSRAGQEVPRLSASEHARRKVREMLPRPVVTMTMRSTYMSERNSDVDAWWEARKYIVAQGYSVYTLQDTDEALSKGVGYGELNLDLRMALYQEAEMNFQANNGAASLCWFSSKPYRMFGAAVTAEEWDGLFVKQGLRLGETWPWASSGQKICYGKETAEQMIAEFDSWRTSGNL